MTAIHFTAIPTSAAEDLWDGGLDAYGLSPERRITHGGGYPCRHCLDFIAEGQAYLTLAYRPFPALQPYAETGPIFLHAEPCARFEAGEILPPVLTDSPDFILRGYDRDDRIVYGTGAVTLRENIEARANDLLSRDDIAYVHVRSARNNCYQCRIDRT
ncbi:MULTISPECIES: DUF1203 domain-containing protein [Alphaproteobacteria]|nr:MULTISPECIES: DUF1203 domain-containing protein [Alphaproteobacteria]